MPFFPSNVTKNITQIIPKIRYLHQDDLCKFMLLKLKLNMKMVHVFIKQKKFKWYHV